MWVLGHILGKGSGVCRLVVVIWSVAFANVLLKGSTGDENVDAVGTLIVVWEVSVKDLQDGVVGPIGAVAAMKSMLGS